MVNSVSQLSGMYSQMAMPSGEMRRPDLFGQVDSDGSGGVDQVEISDLAKKLSEATGSTLSVEEIFSTYDTDGDGQLSKSDLGSFMREKAPPPPGGPVGQKGDQAQNRLEDFFAKVDQDGDGSVNKDELSTLVSKIAEETGNSLNVDDLFASYDADGDGALNQTELDSFMRQNAPPPPGGPKPPEAADNTFNVEDVFSTYDTDEDGNWSTAELQNFLLENFSSSAIFGQKASTTSGLVDLSI